MNPWDDDVLEYLNSLHGHERDREECGLWAHLKAKDFFVAIDDDRMHGGAITIYVCPIGFFKTHGCLWNESIPMTHLLPNYLEEIMECVWETEDHSYERVKCDLIARGFVENESFSRFAIGEKITK